VPVLREACEERREKKRRSLILQPVPIEKMKRRPLGSGLDC